MRSATITRGQARRGAGPVGLLGVACTVAMVVPVIGAVGAGAAASTAGMAGMTASAHGGLLGFLLDYGPVILVASIVLVTVSVAWRRPPAAVPALAAGHHHSRAHTTAGQLHLKGGLANGNLLIVTADYLPTRSRFTRNDPCQEADSVGFEIITQLMGSS